MIPPRLWLVPLFGPLLACAHPSGPTPSHDVQVLALRPRLVLAQARFTLRALNFRVLNADTDAVVWALAEIPGHSTVRCNEALNRRQVVANPVLAIVSASDTVGGSAVRVQVIGWRPGELPPLVVGMGSVAPNGPCVSTGSLERELFSVFHELARRAAPSD